MSWIRSWYRPVKYQIINSSEVLLFYNVAHSCYREQWWMWNGCWQFDVLNRNGALPLYRKHVIYCIKDKTNIIDWAIWHYKPVQYLMLTAATMDAFLGMTFDTLLWPEVMNKLVVQNKVFIVKPFTDQREKNTTITYYKSINWSCFIIL